MERPVLLDHLLAMDGWTWGETSWWCELPCWACPSIELLHHPFPETRLPLSIGLFSESSVHFHVFCLLLDLELNCLLLDVCPVVPQIRLLFWIGAMGSWCGISILSHLHLELPVLIWALQLVLGCDQLHHKFVIWGNDYKCDLISHLNLQIWQELVFGGYLLPCLLIFIELIGSCLQALLTTMISK